MDFTFDLKLRPIFIPAETHLAFEIENEDYQATYNFIGAGAADRTSF